MNPNTQGTTTFRSSAAQINLSNTLKSAEAIAAAPLGSCTFLNLTGDITIVWDEENRDRMLELIRKKMAEGYTFFTTKKFLFKTLTRRVKVSKRNVQSIENLIISDEEFEKMVKDIADRDVAELLASDKVSAAKRVGKRDLVALSRAKKAEDVIDKDSMAVRPIRGG